MVDGFVKKLYILKNFRIILETSWNIIQCEMGVRIRNVIGRLILVRSFVCFTTFTVPRGHDFFAIPSLLAIFIMTLVLSNSNAENFSSHQY